MNEVYVIAGGEWLRNNLNAIAAFMGTRTWDSIEKIALTLSVLAVAVMWVQRHNVMDLLGWVNESERASFLSTLNKMAEKKKNTGKEMFVGVTRVLSDNESKVFFEKVKGQYPEMDIKIPFLTVMETLQYKPAESAAKVQCPVLIVIAGQDSVNPPEQGKALYDAVASGTKELYEEADACHYDIYEGAFFERVAAVQTQWFKKHL